jgi:transcriptional regulator with XRE-family HTH domain
MPRRSIILSASEADALTLLGKRVRRARLRRNLSIATLAERAGTTPKVVRALEIGSSSSGLPILVKVMTTLGYLDRLPDLLASDPIGEDLESLHSRKRAGVRDGLEDF